MKLRILGLALVLTFLAINASVRDSVLAQRASKTRHRTAGVDRWYVLVSPDGEFTVSFPQKPTREPDVAGPVSAVRSYGLYAQNGMRFSVNFQDISTGPNSRLANEWNDVYEQNLLSSDRKNRRRVVRTQRIGKNIFEAEIWDSGSDNGESINYLRQTIIRRARIYTLLCGSELYGRKVDKSICRRFFNSMHFLIRPDFPKNPRRLAANPDTVPQLSSFRTATLKPPTGN